MIRLTEEEAGLITSDDEIEGKDYVMVEDADWRDDGKYQFGEYIFSSEGKFYVLRVSRSGSYYTDYYYDYMLDCPEVEKAQRVEEYWRPVKQKAG